MDHINALFEGQELSEEFKVKATAIVESALAEREAVIREAVETELKADYEARIEERVKELEQVTESYISEEVMPSIDKYLTAAVNEWLEENKVGIEANAKVQMAESFLHGLVGLAGSHNLKISEAESTQIAELEAKLEAVKESLNQLTDRNIALIEENQSFKKSAVAGSITADLSEAQKDKIAGIVERIEFKDEDQYAAAVKSIVESYFPVSAKPEVEETVVNKPAKVDESAKSYTSRLMESVLAG